MKRIPKKTLDEMLNAIGQAVSTRLRIRRAEYDKLASEAVFSGKIPDRLNALKSKGALEELEQVSRSIRKEIFQLYGIEDDSKGEV